MSILPNHTFHNFNDCKLYNITKSIDRFYKIINVRNLSREQNLLSKNVKNLVLDNSSIKCIKESINGTGPNSFSNFILYFNNKYDQGDHNTIIDLNEIHIDIKNNIVCTKWNKNEFHKFHFNYHGNRITHLEF